MKTYKQLLESLPNKNLIAFFDDFVIPTLDHQRSILFVKKLAEQTESDYAILVTNKNKKNPLTLEQKLHYLNIVFPNTNIVVENSEILKKYQNVVIASDKKIFENYKLDKTINENIMIGYATKNDYPMFKKGLPSNMRDVDGKRLMNDVRAGMNLEPIKESVDIRPNTLRERYFNKEIFNIGDIVESIIGEEFEIIKRGTNNVLCKDSNGNVYNKWIYEIHEVNNAR